MTWLKLSKKNFNPSKGPSSQIETIRNGIDIQAIYKFPKQSEDEDKWLFVGQRGWR